MNCLYIMVDLLCSDIFCCDVLLLKKIERSMYIIFLQSLDCWKKGGNFDMILNLPGVASSTVSKMS